MKTTLKLTHIEARQYFLKQQSYCNMQLPEYFNFQPLIENLIKDKILKNNSKLFLEAKKL
jgi:hypothetical protein